MESRVLEGLFLDPQIARSVSCCIDDRQVALLFSSSWSSKRSLVRDVTAAVQVRARVFPSVCFLCKKMKVDCGVN